jgi:hypothetical protein
LPEVLRSAEVVCERARIEADTLGLRAFEQPLKKVLRYQETLLPQARLQAPRWEATRLATLWPRHSLSSIFEIQVEFS